MRDSIRSALKDNIFFVKLAIAGICFLLVLAVSGGYVEKEKFFGLLEKANSMSDVDFSVVLTHTDNQGYFNQYCIDGTKLASAKQLELNIAQTGNPDIARIWANETEINIDPALWKLITPVLFGDINSEYDYEQVLAQIDMEKFSKIKFYDFWDKNGSINPKISILSPILLLDTLLQDVPNVKFQNSSITLTGTDLSNVVNEFKDSWLDNLNNLFNESNVTLADMCTLLFDALPQVEKMTYSVSEKSGVITRTVELSNASDTWVLTVDMWRSFHTFIDVSN